VLLIEGKLVHGAALFSTHMPALYSTGGNLLSLRACHRLTMPHWQAYSACSFQTKDHTRQMQHV
jgi:hypothetical protein